MKSCIWCQKPHDRKKFCSNRCKDKYHNRKNPRGKFAYLGVWHSIKKAQQEERLQEFIANNPHYIRDEEDLHPHSSDALGQC